jgi:hypothetical protein
MNTIFGNILCGALNLILLNNNGAFFSLSNLHDVSLNLTKYEKYHFTGTHTKQCSYDEFLQMVDKVSQLDIYEYKRDDITRKTIIQKPDQYVKLDDIVSITTYILEDLLYITSFEKVAICSKTDNSYELLMTTCSENVVNGYYQYNLKYVDGNATITYKKSQSPATFMYGFIGRILYPTDQHYYDFTAKYMTMAINYVSNSTDFLAENVIFEKR